MAHGVTFQVLDGIDKGRVFRDVTAEAGVAGSPDAGYNSELKWKWSTSAAFLDYDNDGKLDLFVCNYVKWSPSSDVLCSGPHLKKLYCTPEPYPKTPNLLYRSEGKGRFSDVSQATGIARFEDAHTIKVTRPHNYEILTADYVVIATGTTPARPATGLRFRRQQRRSGLRRTGRAGVRP